MSKVSAAAATAGVALAVSAAPAVASHSWGNYHWGRTANPFPLTLTDSVESHWDAYLASTSTDWDTPLTPIDTSIAEGATDKRTRKRCPAIGGKVRACNAAYGNTGWLGVASIWASGDHITQATTKVNDTYFDTPTYDRPEWRQMVMCQEIGHDFGLDHQDEAFDNPNLGTCMDYTDNPLGPPSNEHPNQHDYDQLNLIYGHTDATNTWSASTTSSGSGKLRRLKDSLFVEDLGGRKKRFVFVIWTDRGRHHAPPAGA